MFVSFTQGSPAHRSVSDAIFEDEIDDAVNVVTYKAREKNDGGVQWCDTRDASVVNCCCDRGEHVLR